MRSEQRSHTVEGYSIDDTYWFRPGDVVELRSGGPPMSVEGYSADDDEVVVCQWYDEGRREYRREAFRLPTLSLITD